MKSKLFAALLIATTLVAAPAVARDSVPIVNYDNVAVATSSGKAPDAEQVRQAIAAAAAGKGWTVAPAGDGKLQATIVVRGKHTVVVDIAYAADKYALTYKDSTNMNFIERDGQKLIHPFYNKWVQTLKEAIRLELLKA